MHECFISIYEKGGTHLEGQWLRLGVQVWSLLRELRSCMFHGVAQNWCCCCCLVVSNSFVTLWTAGCQALLSMRFPRQEYLSGLPFPSPGDLPNSGTELMSLALQADSLPLSHQGSPLHTHTYILRMPRRMDLKIHMCGVCVCVCVCICVYIHTYVYEKGQDTGHPESNKRGSLPPILGFTEYFLQMTQINIEVFNLDFPKGIHGLEFRRSKYLGGKKINLLFSVNFNWNEYLFQVCI